MWIGLLFLIFGSSALAQPCPEEPALQNYTGGGSVVCPCFIPGERAGAVLEAPAEHYPIEILRVGIGWASQYGGAPQSLEEAIRIYAAGLPDPGTPIFSLDGPVLTDGVINEYNLEPEPGEITIASGPFTVVLEFFNSNSGSIFSPSMVHDGNGCQPGKNVVYAIPGGWFNACVLGIGGDWIVYAIYRQVNCLSGIDDGEQIVSNAPGLVRLRQNYPNPFNPVTVVPFDLTEARPISLRIYALDGSLVKTLIDGPASSGSHQILWSGCDDRGRPVPAGVYYYRIEAGADSQTLRMMLVK
jgi:hypothetical protein